MESKLDGMRELAGKEISPEERAAARCVLSRCRAAVFIVAYNAERHLESVIARIPEEIRAHLAEIFIIDDSSTDRTFEVAHGIRDACPDGCVNVYRTPFNRGYGGNQKLGYMYCAEKGYDLVVLLHGDGQYAPEYLPRIFAAFDDPSVDVVFASRMIDKKAALRGGMPVYKWLGNQVLTGFENRLLGTSFSEFHTGFRAYKVSSLARVPYQYNSDDFHFDTEIIIQAVAAKWKLREVSIPTYYGDETCHVNGVKYAINCLKAVIKYRLVNLGLYYDRSFDFDLFENDNYQFKRSPYSLHQYVIRDCAGRFTPGTVSIELGANRGILSSHVAGMGGDHTAVDIFLPDQQGKAHPVAMDLNTAFADTLGRERHDVCIALDIVEHMNDPERFLREAFLVMKAGGRIYISTANICYLFVRASLLLGQFNYGKRGILDRTHTRLFSIRGMKKMLKQSGFRVESVEGFAPPLTDLIGRGGFMRVLEAVHARLARFAPRLFAYNFLVVATRMDDLPDIFERTIRPADRTSAAGS